MPVFAFVLKVDFQDKLYLAPLTTVSAITLKSVLELVVVVFFNVFLSLNPGM